jgi:hypothetical protein
LNKFVRDYVIAAVTAPVTLAGDFNHDGRVDATDYVIWRDNPATYGGSTGFTDWRANFGKTVGSSTALVTIPEPSTMLLIVATLVTMSARRRKP